MANADTQPFPNYTPQENQAKYLFLQPPVFDLTGIRTNGSIGCAGCHQAPEFDIYPNSLNNGITGVANGTGTDVTATRATSLRDVVNQNGERNGPFMHIGILDNLITAINHYNEINLAANNNLDQRLRPNAAVQQLNMTQQGKDAVIAFRKLYPKVRYIQTQNGVFSS